MHSCVHFQSQARPAYRIANSTALLLHEAIEPLLSAIGQNSRIALRACAARVSLDPVVFPAPPICS